jgi:UDP-N-acetylglucosamine--N-acetylmuramyl-(pentapeptide) pyrophosphoryl-undecaprenol N-acetylglucosamine transferase
MKGDQAVRVAFTGGGTGGHVYPALALADRLLARSGYAGIYIGIPGRAEERILRARTESGLSDLPFCIAPSMGFPGFKSLSFPLFLMRLGLGTVVAGLHLLRFRPRLLVATGGYASAPAVFAAGILRRLGLLSTRILIHEQNAETGLLNKLAARLADAFALTFNPEGSAPIAEKARVTGYPVRDTLMDLPATAAARRQLGLEEDRPTLFIFGGSLGARSINRAVYAMLPILIEGGIQVIHGYGSADGPEYSAIREHDKAMDELVKHVPDMHLYHAAPYFHQIHVAYAAADLVVGRGGAGTLFELCRSGKPLLVVPKMGLPGDHQVANARSAQAAGAVDVQLEEILLGEGSLEAGVNPDSLVERITELLSDSQRLAELSEGAKRFASGESLNKLEALALELLEKGRIEAAIEPRASAVRDRTIESLSTSALMAHPACQTTGPERDYIEYRALSALGSPRWQVRNAGIKLCAALKLDRALPIFEHLVMYHGRVPLIPRLLGERHQQNGFIRRNIATALGSLSCDDPCVRLLCHMLKDPYWEVRVAALTSLSRQAREANTACIEAARLMRLSNFEERMAVAAWWSRCMPVDTWHEWLLPLLSDDNCRVREEALRALDYARSMRGLCITDELRDRLDATMLTSTYFHPVFPLKQARRDIEDTGGAEC